MKIQELIDNVKWLSKKEIQWFLRFLIESGAYHAFITEVALRKDDWYATLEPYEIISGAFIWPDDSKYGISFGSLSNLWRHYLRAKKSLLTTHSLNWKGFLD